MGHGQSWAPGSHFTGEENRSREQERIGGRPRPRAQGPHGALPAPSGLWPLRNGAFEPGATWPCHPGRFWQPYSQPGNSDTKVPASDRLLSKTQAAPSASAVRRELMSSSGRGAGDSWPGLCRLANRLGGLGMAAVPLPGPSRGCWAWPPCPHCTGALAWVISKARQRPHPGRVFPGPALWGCFSPGLAELGPRASFAVAVLCTEGV